MSDTRDPGGARPGTAGTRDGTGAHRFFDWIRGLGITRGEHGWAGGVCAGIGERTGLDPLIIRGVALVVAVLGGPALFVYAAAWALLPDRAGRIHVQQLGRGEFSPAMIVIGVLAVATAFPFLRGLWWQGPPAVWGMPDWLETTMRVGWALALTAGILWFVVFAATRSARSSARRDIGDAPSDGAGGAGEGARGGRPPASGADRPQQGAEAHTGAESREGTSQDWGRAASEWGRNAGEAMNRGIALWRARTPGAAFVAIVLGLALVGGVAGALVASGATGAPLAWGGAPALVGLASAVAVLGLGIVVAGVRGRTSGGLGFFSIVAVLALAAAGILPAGTRFVPFGDAQWSVASAPVSSDAGYAMVAGSTRVDLSRLDAAGSHGGTVDVLVGFGEIALRPPEGESITVETNTLVSSFNGPGSRAWRGDDSVFGHDERRIGHGPVVAHVRVWSLFGSINVESGE